MSHLSRISVRRVVALAGAVAISASLAAAAVGTSPAEAATFPSIAAGQGHTCAIKANATAICWGDSNFVPADLGTVKQITAGPFHTCAIKTNDTATCWGDNGDGQTSVPADLGSVKQISAGGTHTCAIKADGKAVCWGRNNEGQSSVPPDLGAVKQITAGGYHTCAIKTNDTTACWGDNSSGQTSVPTDLGAVKQITAGDIHTCAIQTNDTAICWGDNVDGQTSVPTSLGTVKQITAGIYHTCAIKTNDTAVCWGWDRDGQSSVPADLGAVKQITAAYLHTCAIKTNGSAACWGSNDSGQASVPAGAFPNLSGAVVDLGDSSGLDFGDVTGGQRSIALKSFITSSPSLPGVPLTIGSVTLTNSGSGAFQLLSQSCTTGQVVTAGSRCPLRVRFSPKIWQRGDISAQVTVTDDSPEGTHTIPLTGFALPPASFTLQNFSWALGVGLTKQFDWESSDSSKVTLTLTQPVTTTVTVKKGKKVTKKTVTTIKPVTLVANKSAAAGPGVFDWNGKVNGKAAAKGNWTATITAVSARGKASLTQPVTIR